MESRTSLPEPSWVELENLRMRDPFVWVAREQGRYYLYGTTDPDPWHGQGVGFDAYYSDTLDRFHGPYPAYRPAPDFWGSRNFWAPEVYPVEDHFILIASFHGDTHGRSVQALRADQPLGPFHEHGERLTPPDWECLDGTLFYEDGEPWLIFCHEWLQINDGTICRVRLNDDLARSQSEPEVLFHASDAPWVRPVQEKYHFVTDGPFLHRSADGSLLLLWSSFAAGGYAVGVSYSRSGRLEGPWVHHRRPLYSPRRTAGEGGHAMVFEDLRGQLTLALHRPNKSPDERPSFLPLAEAGSSLEIVGTERRWWPWQK